MVLVSIWQESLIASKKELSFLEIYISSPIFKITPELLSKFEDFQMRIKKLNSEQENLTALANKHQSVLDEWDEIDESTFEDFLLNEQRNDRN